MAGPNPTIGYKYHLGMQLALAHGPVDSVNSVEIDERPVWDGTTIDSQIYIDKPDLFGEFEGGISGAVDLLSGKRSQGENSYLKGVLPNFGGKIPAFRGVASAVLRRPYLSNNPYLKSWSFLLQRVFSTSDGSPSWNPSLAAVKETGVDGYDVTQRFSTLAPSGWYPGGAPAPFTSVFEDKANGQAFFVLTRGTSGGYSGSGVQRYDTNSLGFTGRVYDPSSLYYADGAYSVSFSGGFVGVRRGTSSASIRLQRLSAANLSVEATSGVVPDVQSGARNTLLTVPYRGEAHILSHDAYGGVPAGVKVFQYYPNQEDDFPDPLFYDYDLPRYTYLDATNLTLVRSFKKGFWLLATGGSIPAGSVGVTRYEPEFVGAVEYFTEYDYGVHVVGTSTLYRAAGETSEGDLFLHGEGTLAVLQVNDDRTLELLWAQEGTGAQVANRENPHSSWQTAPLIGEVRLVTGGTNDPTVSSFNLTNGDLIYEDVEIPVGLSDANRNTLIQQAGLFDKGLFFYANTDARTLGFDIKANIRNADMNPAHIIRESLTNSVWGRGLPESLLDDDSFSAAAATLFTEKLGLSLLWAKETSINDFIQIVLNHIDGVLYVDRRTGKFVLKLIRADYGDGSSLLALDDTNVISWSEVNQPSYNDLVNTVTIQFNDRDNKTGGSVTLHNLALIQIQGREISTVRQYQGVCTRALAGRIAARDLRASSTPLVSGTLTVTSDIEDLYPGSPFRLSSPRHGVRDLVCRVTEIDVGNHQKGEIKIKFAQDVFGTLFSGALSEDTPPPSSFITPPVASQQEVAVEAPYWFLENTRSTSEVEQILTDNPDAGFLLATAARPGDNMIEARVLVSEGANNLDFGKAPLAPYIDLSRDLTDDPADGNLSLTTGRDFDSIEVGMLGKVGGELVFVQQISSNSITLGRGALDTVPQPHLAGEEVVFLTSYGRVFSPEFNASESRTVYVAPENSFGTVPLSDVTPVEVNFDSRASRPLPAGNVRVDGSLLRSLEEDNPEFDTSAVLSWSSRNRLTQVTDAHLSWLSGSTVPEPNTEYRVVVEEKTGANPFTQVADVNVGTDTSYTLVADALGVCGSDFIRVKVISQRDGYENFQAKTGILTVIPCANFITSDGDVLITADGETFLIQE